MSTLASKAPRTHAALAGVWAYPLPAPRRVRLALAGVLLLTVALWLGWLSASQPRFWQAGSALAAIALVAILVFRMPLWKWGTSLQWTGSKWRLVQAVPRAEEGGDLASLVVAMDGQSWILLRAHPEPTGQAVRWLLLLRASSPERWPDIRRVLYSSITVSHPV